jgi:hypothetical protein
MSATTRPEDPRRPASPAPHTEGKTIRWARLYDLGTTLLSFGQLAALHPGGVPGRRLQGPVRAKYVRFVGAAALPPDTLVNVRLAWSFKLLGQDAEVAVQVFNLLDDVHREAPGGDLIDHAAVAVPATGLRPQAHVRRGSRTARVIPQKDGRFNLNPARTA